MATTKRISDADMAYLQTHEQVFTRLVYSHYNSTACGNRDLDLLADFYKRHTGFEYRLNRNCATCIGRFLTEIGTWYFKEKGLRAVEKDAPKQTAPKTAVKASRKGAKKKSK